MSYYRLEGGIPTLSLTVPPPEHEFLRREPDVAALYFSSMVYLDVAIPPLKQTLSGPSVMRAALYGVSALFGALLWKIVRFIVRSYTTKLRNLPGPPSPSWIFGNLRELQRDSPSVLEERWVEEYGSKTLMYRGMWNVRPSRFVCRCTHTDGVAFRRIPCGRLTHVPSTTF